MRIQILSFYITKEIIKMLIEKNSVHAIYKYLIKKYKLKISRYSLSAYIKEIQNSLESMPENNGTSNSVGQQLIKSQAENPQKEQNPISVQISEKAIDDRVAEIHKELDKVEKNVPISGMSKIEILKKQLDESYALCRIMVLKLRQRWDLDLVDSYKNVLGVNLKITEMMAKLSGEMVDEKIVINLVMPFYESVVRLFFRGVDEFAPEAREQLLKFMDSRIRSIDMPAELRRIIVIDNKDKDNGNKDKEIK